MYKNISTISVQDMFLFRKGYLHVPYVITNYQIGIIHISIQINILKFYLIAIFYSSSDTYSWLISLTSFIIQWVNSPQKCRFVWISMKYVNQSKSIRWGKKRKYCIGLTWQINGGCIISKCWCIIWFNLLSYTPRRRRPTYLNKANLWPKVRDRGV